MRETTPSIELRIESHLIKGMILLFVFISILPTSGQTQYFSDKINGMSYCGPEHPTQDYNSFSEISDINSNWVALIPEATLNRATLQLRPEWQNHWWSRTIEGNIQSIKIAKEQGLRVMLKPQISLDRISHPNGYFSNKVKLEDRNGKIVIDKTNGASWRGEFEAETERDWRVWEASYERYILSLARVADSLSVDIFCIGTELRKSATLRPKYWIHLIEQVRNIYKGPVIYSANWDEYEAIDFWSHLDYLGVNAYFSVSLMPTPRIKSTSRNWNYFRKNLRKFSKRHKKQLIVTEFGYRNVSFAGLRPWTHDKGNSKVNNEAQTNLYTAFFESFWNEEWILGGFSWNWDAIQKHKNNTDFSIQGKPALAVLKDWFGRKRISNSANKKRLTSR